MEKHLNFGESYFIWNNEKETLQYMGSFYFGTELGNNYYELHFNRGSLSDITYIVDAYWISKKIIDKHKAKDFLYLYNRDIGDEYDDLYYERLLCTIFMQGGKGFLEKSLVVKEDPLFVDYSNYKYYLEKQGRAMFISKKGK